MRRRREMLKKRRKVDSARREIGGVIMDAASFQQKFRHINLQLSHQA